MAGTMMMYLPPEGWGEIATKGDLALLRGDVERLRGEFAGLRAELNGFRDELTGCEVELANLRVELHRTLRVNMFSLVGFMVAVAAAQISAMALLV